MKQKKQGEKHGGKQLQKGNRELCNKMNKHNGKLTDFAA
jgi:hypothetical protein